MDTIFWVGLAAGAVLSFLASIVANLFHAKLLGFLDNRKVLFTEKRHRKAKDLHKLIFELHSGVRDRYLYLLRLVIAANVMSMMAVGGLFSGLILLALTSPPTVPFTDDVPPELYFRLGFIFSTLFIAAVCVYLEIFAIKRFRMIETALTHFTEYETAFKAKWGDDSI